MKAVLTFNLNDEDDKYKYEEMMDASAMQSSLSEGFRTIRNKLKYDSYHPSTKDEIAALPQEVQSVVYGILYREIEHLRDTLRDELTGCKTEF